MRSKRLEFLFIGWVLHLVHCAVPAPIMQVQSTVEVDGVGINANIFYNQFQSSVSGSTMVLSFSNAEGDIVEVSVIGLSGGSYDMSSPGNTLTITFASANATAEDNDVGTFTISNIVGTAPNITAISGNFQVNLRTDTDPVAGTVLGQFNYVAQ